jgi:hypothetical protein
MLPPERHYLRRRRRGAADLAHASTSRTFVACDTKAGRLDGSAAGVGFPDIVAIPVEGWNGAGEDLAKRAEKIILLALADFDRALLNSQTAAPEFI